MTSNEPSITVESLLSHLKQRGYLKSSEVDAKKILDSLQGEEELPLYARFLVGVGAFLSSSFLIGFLTAARILRLSDEFPAIVWGVAFIVLACLTIYQGKKVSNQIANSFLVQISFCFIATGKILFVSGMSNLIPGEFRFFVAVTIITSITYYFYRLTVDRFLSTLGVLTSLFIALWNYNQGLDFVPTYLIVCVLGVALFVAFPKIGRDFFPIKYAFGTALSGVVVTMVLYGTHRFFPERIDKSILQSSNAILTLSLVLCLVHIVGGWKNLLRESVLVALGGCLLLGLVSAPGITLSLGLITLGYSRSDWVFCALGIVGLPIFLFSYYYFLPQTLLDKSMLLMASGAILLAGAAYVRYRVLPSRGRL